MNIEEGNKLIAEFMGWNAFPGNMIKEKLGVAPIRIDGLKFHSSWDWLMPVVEKIEEIHDSNPIVYVVINGYGCEISYMVNHNWPEDRDVIVDMGYPEAQSKIESVWKAVVKFIEKHNEYTSSLQS